VFKSENQQGYHDTLVTADRHPALCAKKQGITVIGVEGNGSIYRIEISLVSEFSCLFPSKSEYHYTILPDWCPAFSKENRVVYPKYPQYSPGFHKNPLPTMNIPPDLSTRWINSSKNVYFRKIRPILTLIIALYCPFNLGEKSAYLQ
jgi:hypothetical protein